MRQKQPQMDYPCGFHFCSDPLHQCPIHFTARRQHRHVQHPAQAFPEMFRAMHAQHHQRILGRKTCRRGLAADFNSGEAAVQIPPVDWDRKIPKGSFSVNFDENFLGMRKERVLPGRGSFFARVRFVCVEQRAVPLVLEQGYNFWNVFLLDGKIQILVLAADKASIRNPGQ